MIVKELTRESYPPQRYASYCVGCGPSTERVAHGYIAYLEGWWEAHVQKTGHRVVIEDRFEACEAVGEGR